MSVTDSAGRRILDGVDRQRLWDAALAEATKQEATKLSGDSAWVTVRSHDVAALVLLAEPSTDAAWGVWQRLVEALSGAAPTTTSTLLTVLAEPAPGVLHRSDRLADLQRYGDALADSAA